jgi:hypothetical protein
MLRLRSVLRRKVAQPAKAVGAAEQKVWQVAGAVLRNVLQRNGFRLWAWSLGAAAAVVIILGYRDIGLSCGGNGGTAKHGPN